MFSHEKDGPRSYDVSAYAYRAPEDLKGEKFIFHPKPVSLRKFHYPQITRTGPSGEQVNPTYNECVGRQGTIISVKPAGTTEYIITLKMDDTGTEYTVRTRSGSMEGLVSSRDLENAAKLFLGKRFRSLKDGLMSYDTTTGEYDKVYAGEHQWVTITDIVPGWDTKTPVRLIVETLYEQTGYVEINLTGTNVPSAFRNRNNFEEYFSSDDIRKWDPDIKNFIENGLVKEGMTTAQVKRSWGIPVEISDNDPSGREKWSYPYGDVLYFMNGKLVKRTKEDRD